VYACDCKQLWHTIERNIYDNLTPYPPENCCYRDFVYWTGWPYLSTI